MEDGGRKERGRVHSLLTVRGSGASAALRNMARDEAAKATIGRCGTQPLVPH